MSTKISIVFFGTGPLAAKSLEYIAREFSVELVITKPKPIHHRGDFPVETLSKKLNLKTTYVTNRQELEKAFTRQKLKSQLGIVIDFGIIIPQKVIDYFKFGIINSHFSLLPRWRGADPITFSILDNHNETGVSLMKIVPELDTGPLIAQEKYILSRDLTSEELSNELTKLSNKMLSTYLPQYLNGDLLPQPQSSEGITYSRKLTKEDGIIDWNKSADQIEREIRAFHEWPKSRVKLGDIEVIITKAHNVPSDGKPGKVEIAADDILIAYCKKGYLCIERLKPIGKNEMSTEEFIRGYKSRLRLS